MNIRISVDSLSVSMTVPSSANRTTQGLLGTYNGDFSDDLTAPDGNITDPGASEGVIFNQFGQKCKNNLKIYPQGYIDREK